MGVVLRPIQYEEPTVDQKIEELQFKQLVQQLKDKIVVDIPDSIEKTIALTSLDETALDIKRALLVQRVLE